MALKDVSKALPSDLNSWVDEAKIKKMINSLLEKGRANSKITQMEVDLSQTLGLATTARMREVESLEFERDKSISVSVYCGQSVGNASTTDFSEQALESALAAALGIAQMTEDDPSQGLPEAELLVKSPKDCKLHYPWAISPDEAIDLALKIEEAGLSDPLIVNSEGGSVSSSQGFHVLANSHGFYASYATSRHSMSCVLIGEKNGQMERDYAYTMDRDPTKLMDVATIGHKAREKTLSRLGAKRISSRQCPVIFHNELASGFFSPFFSAISGGAQYRKQTFLLDSIGQKVFPDFVTVRQTPHVPSVFGSAPFDNDGVETRDRLLIDKGEVQGYLMGVYSARQLKMSTTGNAGGLFHSVITANQPDLEALLKQMGTGLLVTELMGSGVNPTTGDYSRGAAGFWVESGEIQYPVHEITIAGNLLEMYRNIVSIAGDIDPQHTLQTGSILVEKMTIAG